MTALELGEVTVTRVIEIGRSTYPTASMLPASTAETIARHHGWLQPFWDDTTGDLGSRIGTWIVRTPEHLALIDTGVRNVAFVERDEGHFEPRDVKTGIRTDDFCQVLGGLAEGEKVVTRALFLVDSESQLKSAISSFDTGSTHQH